MARFANGDKSRSGVLWRVRASSAAVRHPEPQDWSTSPEADGPPSLDAIGHPATNRLASQAGRCALSLACCLMPGIHLR